MSKPPEMPPTSSGPVPAPVSPPEAAKPAYRAPRWLERFELFLRVLLRMYIGITICIAPWWSVIWDQNPLFLQFPQAAVYLSSGAVRGVVSGLGLLNLWFAFEDAIHHWDNRP
jgi:hypothetical protein